MDDGDFVRIYRELKRWRGPLLMTVPIAVGAYEAWDFSHSHDFGCLGVLAWGMAYNGRRRLDGMASRFARRAMLHAPRVAFCSQVALQVCQTHNAPLLLAAPAAAVMAAVLTVLDTEEPPLEEPVKEAKIVVLRLLSSDTRLLSAPENVDVYIDCEVEGAVADDFAIELHDRETGKTTKLAQLDRIFFSRTPLGGTFLLRVSQSSPFAEKVTVNVKMRKVPASKTAQPDDK